MYTYIANGYQSRITQLVECETVNLKVEGSIPSVRAPYFYFALGGTHDLLLLAGLFI